MKLSHWYHKKSQRFYLGGRDDTGELVVFRGPMSWRSLRALLLHPEGVPKSDPTMIAWAKKHIEEFETDDEK